MTRVKELTVGQVYRNRNRNGYRYIEDVEPEVVKLERVSDGGMLLACRIRVYEDGCIE